MRRLLVCALLQGDADDHFAAAMLRRHRLQKFRATVKRADTSGRAHFVSGEGKKIAADFLHVDGQMSGALRGIDQRDGADCARVPAKFGYGIDRA